MNLRDALTTTRFRLNMERINGLAKLIYSDIALLKPTGFAKSEGPRADILRAIVVFLHSTFEDVLRSRAYPYDKKFTFYSGADIDKILRKCRLDPTPFKPLYSPLTQMAKRRTRIVHYADLSKQSDTAAEAWTIVDEWQLIMWMLAVMAFHSLLTSIDHDDEVAHANYLKLREAMDGFVTFGKRLVAFADTPREFWIESLQKISQTLDSVSAALLIAKTHLRK
jgi:hypothetical protein